MTGPIPDEAPQPNWKLRNRMYSCGIFLYFLLVFYFAHNRILFGTWLPYSRSDLVPLVEQRLAPVVRAMKQYQSIHGVLPADERNLAPWFPAPDAHSLNKKLWGDSIWNGSFSYRHEFGQITYTFSPGQEGWEIHGTVLNGRIPAPIVTTQP